MQVKIFGKNVLEVSSTSKTDDAAQVNKVASPPSTGKAKRPRVSAGFGPNYSNYNTFYVHSFTGEKNSGDMGPIRDYYIDYESLRTRSWQLYLESEVCQTIFRKMTLWTIGKGLKLQTDPQVDVLASEKITLKSEDFNDVVESRFETYSKSKIADYSGVYSLHTLAKMAYINSIVGGDCLVVLRLINGQVKVELIDGCHVQTPSNVSYMDGQFRSETGTVIRNGIEIDSTRKPIAYHVRTNVLEFERIPAYGPKTGRLMAFMVESPLKFRINNNRSLPLLAAVMETVSKMDRYKEATLGSAEEAAKIAYSIEHAEFSTGENPLLEQMAEAAGYDVAVETVDGEALASKVAATTGKQVVNMPSGASLKGFESKKELYFKDFFSVNILLVCATIGMPKDVALSQYESNYSASRAAIKDWEHQLEVGRDEFSMQFYQRIYEFWLDTQVLANKVQAPGYLEAMMSRDEMSLAAYRYSRWIGANVPHIDPLTEVQAARLKLGKAADHLPLTTLEQATEALGEFGSWSNLEQFSREMEEAKRLKIKPEAKPGAAPADDESNKEEDS